MKPSPSEEAGVERLCDEMQLLEPHTQTHKHNPRGRETHADVSHNVQVVTDGLLVTQGFSRSWLGFTSRRCHAGDFTGVDIDKGQIGARRVFPGSGRGVRCKHISIGDASTPSPASSSSSVCCQRPVARNQRSPLVDIGHRV